MCCVEGRAGAGRRLPGQKKQPKPNTSRGRTCSQIDGPTGSAVAVQGGKARDSPLQLVHWLARPTTTPRHQMKDSNCSNVRHTPPIY